MFRVSALQTSRNSLKQNAEARAKQKKEEKENEVNGFANQLNTSLLASQQSSQRPYIIQQATPKIASAECKSTQMNGDLQTGIQRIYDMNKPIIEEFMREVVPMMNHWLKRNDRDISDTSLPVRQEYRQVFTQNDPIEMDDDYDDDDVEVNEPAQPTKPEKPLERAQVSDEPEQVAVRVAVRVAEQIQMEIDEDDTEAELEAVEQVELERPAPVMELVQPERLEAAEELSRTGSADQQASDHFQASQNEQQLVYIEVSTKRPFSAEQVDMLFLMPSDTFEKALYDLNVDPSLYTMYFKDTMKPFKGVFRGMDGRSFIVQPKHQLGARNLFF